MPLLRILSLVVAVSIAAPAVARPVQPFSIAALKAAQAHGQAVLVDVFAPWCPTCRAQAPTIDAIAADPAFAKLLILRLDYDHQAAEKRALRIDRQSVLITYRGTTETGRVLGITNPGDIRAFATAALR